MSDTEETIVTVEPVTEAVDVVPVETETETETETVEPEDAEATEEPEETEVSEDPVEAPVEESSEPVVSVEPVVQVAADIRNILSEVPSPSVETVENLPVKGIRIKRMTIQERKDFDLKKMKIPKS